MSRLVLDTNALIQCLPNKSPYRKIWNSILEGDNTLCVSNGILEEYEEILDRMYGPQIADFALLSIVNRATLIHVTPYFRYNLIEADPDDNKFVNCAIAGNVDFLISEDHHFDILKETDFPPVNLIGLDDFLKRL